MFRRNCVASTVVFLSLASAAQAHFVWVVAEPGPNGQSEARVRFSEDAELPDAARLIKKITQTKLVQRTAEGAQAIELKEVTKEDQGELVGALKPADAYALEAVCDYGLFTRQDKPMLLQYYAKHLEAGCGCGLEKVARSEKLPLDIVPAVQGEELQLQVLWQGKPLAEAPVTTVSPNGDQEEASTDQQGRVSLRQQEPGLYAIRVGHDEDQAGTRDGKPYESTRHYTTLTLHLPLSQAAATSANEPTASELLESARQARAVWEDFPGFTADATLTVDGEKVQGKLIVDESGEVTLELPQSAGAEWAQQRMSSLVSHRMPGDEIGSGGSFVDEERDHPLGRLVKLEEEAMGSVYRIRDNAVTEVNRNAGPSRFTISVLDVHWNEEQKYLPKVYNVTFWDRKSGELKHSHTITNEWKRVKNFDLPARLLEVDLGDGKRQVKELEFSGHKLLGDEAKTAAVSE